LEWTVAGFSDFSGKANESDMLMRNSNTGAFEVYDISNNVITSAGPTGQVGFEWPVHWLSGLAAILQRSASAPVALLAIDRRFPWRRRRSSVEGPSGLRRACGHSKRHFVYRFRNKPWRAICRLSAGDRTCTGAPGGPRARPLSGPRIGIGNSTA
jgi:hypothetical protein